MNGGFIYRKNGMLTLGGEPLLGVQFSQLAAIVPVLAPTFTYETVQVATRTLPWHTKWPFVLEL